MKRTLAVRKICRPGFSLLEVTIATMMAAMVVTMAAGVTYDVSRVMAGNIAQTQIAIEARLAVESFRRDFGGSSQDIFHDETYEWRLVGRLIPTTDELRLCFDRDLDASADWAEPDRVITYSVDGDQLLRSDGVSGTTITIAHNISDVQFAINGNDINIVIEFQVGGLTETYTFITSDLL
jgi:type II secretory pathway component PulJ